MTSPRQNNVRTSATLAAAALTLGLLAASPTAAVESGKPTPPSVASDPSHAHHKFGVVIAKHGVNIRKWPTAHSKMLGTIDHGKIVYIKCKVRGEDIKGNDRWYKLRMRWGWVSARYVKNLTHIPWCRH